MEASMFNRSRKTIMVRVKDFKIYLEENALDSESVIALFGFFGIIAYPLFYFINLYLLAPQDYAILSLRLFIGLLCFLLLLKNYWPRRIRSYLPWIWYTTLLISMPFFATFMLLKNHCSAAWCLNFTALLILTMLLMDWVIYTVLISVGILLGILVYSLMTPSPFSFSLDPTPLSFLDFLTTCVVSIIMGIILSHRKKLIEQGKFQALRVIGANIAHELRTPLASIKVGVHGAKIYFPRLVDTYRLARESKLNIPDISSDHFKTLLALFDSLEEEIVYSTMIIDMLLMKSKQRDFSKGNLGICSINYCISEALRRYPFKEGESQLISWDNGKNFNFKGEPLLILHIFFNLLKNALYFIEQEGKGVIKIWHSDSPGYNIIHFQDTAKGIPEHIMERLFERFVSDSSRGTGLGLAFCKMVMQGLGGDIMCNSTYGKFTNFALYFPKIAGN